MNLGAIIEVAIGIIFVWIVLSLAIIQIQEWISSKLDKRAKDMEAAIHEMLANPNLKAQFYDHPVIRGLTAKKRKKPSETPKWYYRWPIIKGFTREKRRLPSYIPSQQFALAIFDIAMTAGTEASIIQQGILRVRDDLQRDKKLTVYEAVIEELNLLAELARSAAATEAGTAITNKTTKMLKDEADQFLDKFAAKYPKLKLDKEVRQKITAGLKEALEEAVRLHPELKSVADKIRESRKEPALAKVRRGIAALSVISPEVNQTLNALTIDVEEYITDKEKAIARARDNVEKWFDDSMDRVTGAYKRYAQALAFLIGLFTALILNVDSIGLTFYLWREPSVRAVLANRAEDFQLNFDAQNTDTQGDPLQTFREQFTGLKLPVGWSLKDKNDPLFMVPAADPSTPGTTAVGCKLLPQGQDYFGISFPDRNIGFLRNKCLMPSQPDRSTNIFVKLLGIFITAVAARQGAPFWFDILKHAVNLRATGANPVEKEGR
jgi:hypothetical protein